MNASQLLGSALAFAATLAPRYERDFILERLPSVAEQIERREVMVERCRVGTGGLSVRGLEVVTQFVRAIGPDKAVLAVSQFGPTMLCVPTLATCGVKIACAYWAIAPAIGEILEAGGAVLLDLNRELNARSLLRRLAALQHAGRVIALIVEAPMQSRRRYSFMGYNVRCSSLLELYATSLKKVVLPLSSRIAAPDQLQMIVGEALPSPCNFTQVLLTGLENMIDGHFDQYMWSPASIVFSDPRALRSAIDLAPEILDWRETVLRRQPTVGSGGSCAPAG
jgi:hypothetical protein